MCRPRIKKMSLPLKKNAVSNGTNPTETQQQNANRIQSPFYARITHTHAQPNHAEIHTHGNILKAICVHCLLAVFTDPKHIGTIINDRLLQ